MRGAQRGRVGVGQLVYLLGAGSLSGLTAWIIDSAGGSGPFFAVIFGVLMGAFFLWLTWILTVVVILRLRRIPIEVVAGREWVKAERTWWER
ncbi:hypothetical protein Back2_27560 [Nocardioides baekrokdamisoli]|uniref:Uncharacterized protein n=1 Tax=Nocardioides baekrokdamisoli TaxID=1804624 RepID=A0A3G9J631_9ACTN|nr:hypothetical protein [Nocardioides baekrokdamisoli]BBH18469.1 hypothetical protein Back2_27560 [Nocardioides baekrokdamisoli]